MTRVQIFAVLVAIPLCAFAQEPDEILYEAYRSLTEGYPVILRYEVHQDYAHEPGLVRNFKSELRWDGTRFDVLDNVTTIENIGVQSEFDRFFQERSAHVDPPGNVVGIGNVPIQTKYYNRTIWDGARTLLLTINSTGYSRGFLNSERGVLAWRLHAPFYLGIFDYSMQPFYERMTQIGSLSSEWKSGSNGIRTILVRAENETETYSVWIDPETLLIMKAIVQKTYREPNERGEEKFVISEVFETHVVEYYPDAIRPRIGAMKQSVERTFADGTRQTDKHRIAVVSFDYNPDFEAVGAFEMEWPAGTTVVDMDTNEEFVATENTLAALGE